MKKLLFKLAILLVLGLTILTACATASADTLTYRFEFLAGQAQYGNMKTSRVGDQITVNYKIQMTGAESSATFWMQDNDLWAQQNGTKTRCEEKQTKLTYVCQLDIPFEVKVTVREESKFPTSPPRTPANPPKGSN